MYNRCAASASFTQDIIVGGTGEMRRALNGHEEGGKNARERHADEEKKMDYLCQEWAICGLDIYQKCHLAFTFKFLVYSHS